MAKEIESQESSASGGVKGALTGLGRRKSAVARVRLVSDIEKRIVNQKPFTEYFPTVSMQQQALEPLTTTSQDQIFGFEVRVSGGGKHSQAAAVKLGIARALVASDEGFRKQLKDTKALTRDPRAKERKKFGLKRARRAPQFSKR